MHYQSRSQFNLEDFHFFKERLSEIIQRHKNVAIIWKLVFSMTIISLIINVYRYLEDERVPFSTLIDQFGQLKWTISSLILTLTLYCYGAIARTKSDLIIVQRCKNVLYNYKLESSTNGSVVCVGRNIFHTQD